MTELDKLFSYVKTRSDIKYDGHYLIMNISGVWKGAFGLPYSDHFLEEVDNLKPFADIYELLDDMLQNETHF